VIHVFEVPGFAIEAAAKVRDSEVVVLFREGLTRPRRAELLRELLTDEEYAMYLSQPAVMTP
jgi:hypothetical protein